MNRILTAEEDLWLSSFLGQDWRAGGCVTNVLGNGAAAMQLARDEYLDLLLLDLPLGACAAVLHDLSTVGQPVMTLPPWDDAGE